MPTPRRLENYPSELGELFLKARKRPVTIQFKSQAAAQAARRRLYTYRQALANAEGLVSGYEAIMLIAPLAKMRIEGSELTISYDTEVLQNATTNNSRRGRGKVSDPR